MWTATFAWQDKEFGPAEILKYTQRVEDKKKRRGKHISKTRLEDTYVKEFEEIVRDPDRDIFNEIDEAKIFTYTDKDDFIPESELKKRVLTAEAHASTLATGATRAGQRGGTARPGQMHLYRDSPFRTFYVMAAVDIDLKRFRNHEQATPMYEIPLVAIKAYKVGGVLEMRPGFSEELKPGDPMPGGGGARVSPRKSPRKGAAPGPQLLRRYRFKSARGGVYEYTVENATMDSVARGPDAEADDAALLAAEKAAERRNLAAHAGRITNAFFGEPPRHESFRLHAFIELVAAAKFDAEQLFVEWEVVLPKTAGWKLPAKSAKQTRAVSYLHSAGTAATAAANGLAGVTQTARATWRQWRWGRSDVKVEQGSASATGGAGALSDVPPGCVGTAQQFVGKGVTPGTLTSLKRTRGAMRGASGGSSDPYEGFGRAEPQGRKEPVAHFCFPIEFSLLSHVDMHPQLAAEWPSVAFTVRTRDGWGREHVLGYGFHRLQPGAVCSTATVPTWRPVGTVYQELQDFFLGGATALRDASYAASPDAKLGMVTETSGELALRVNQVIQRHAHDDAASARYKAKALTTQHRVHEVMSRLDATMSSQAGLRATLRERREGGGRPPLGVGESFKLAATGALRKRRDDLGVSVRSLGGDDGGSLPPATPARDRRALEDRLRRRAKDE